MSTRKPQRGEVWRASLDPSRGHEQGGTRPVLVVSDDAFNSSASGMCVVLPITSRDKKIPWHVELAPREGGLTMRSFIKCEDVRAVSAERLQARLGKVEREKMEAVEYRLRLLLNL